MTDDDIVQKVSMRTNPAGVPSAAPEISIISFGSTDSAMVIPGRSVGYPYGSIWNFGIVRLSGGVLEIASGVIMAGGSCVAVPGASVSCSEATTEGSIVCALVTPGEAETYEAVIGPDLFDEATAFGGETTQGDAIVPLFKVAKSGDPAKYTLTKDYVHGLACPQLYSLRIPTPGD